MCIFGIHFSVISLDRERPLLKSFVAPAPATVLIKTWSIGVVKMFYLYVLLFGVRLVPSAPTVIMT